MGLTHLAIKMRGGLVLHYRNTIFEAQFQSGVFE